MINLEEFKNLELVVGRIIEAEEVEKSDKLLKLKVDIGTEERQIIAGIGKQYEPKELINREIIVIANLEPKILFKLESQGMLLAANSKGEPALLQPDKEVPVGTRIS